jgi:sec-independent protein translocase protein TatC
MALVPFPGPNSGAYPLPPEEDDESPGAKMSFLEHLDELRRRIVYSLSAVAVGILVSFTFINRIYSFLMAPTMRQLPPGSKLIYTEPGEAFSLYIYLSLIVGVLLASPFIMYQLWLFIAPGLYSNEKKLAIPFVLLTTVGFVGGAVFNHYVMFPWMMAFFASFNTPDLAFMPKLEDVFGLYTKMLIGMGAVFQMPTIVFFLAKMRLVTARFLWNQLRYAILLTFIVAAIITPTGDPMNQTIFAAPMIGLYVLSIGIAWLVNPRNKEQSAHDSDDRR